MQTERNAASGSLPKVEAENGAWGATLGSKNGTRETRERKTKIEKQEAKHEKETDIDIILVTNYHRVHERHRPIGSRYISVRALLPG